MKKGMKKKKRKFLLLYFYLILLFYSNASKVSIHLFNRRNCEAHLEIAFHSFGLGLSWSRLHLFIYYAYHGSDQIKWKQKRNKRRN